MERRNHVKDHDAGIDFLGELNGLFSGVLRNVRPINRNQKTLEHGLLLFEKIDRIRCRASAFNASNMMWTSLPALFCLNATAAKTALRNQYKDDAKRTAAKN